LTKAEKNKIDCNKTIELLQKKIETKDSLMNVASFELGKCSNILSIKK
jgi:hypothetical protein